MTITSFRLVRRFIAGLFAITHIATLTLQLILHPLFVQPAVSWAMGLFEMVIIGWFITTALIKPLMRFSHPISHELLGSFAIFVVGMVLSLFALTATVSPEEMQKHHISTISAIWIRMLVFSVFAQIGYTFLFVLLAGFTCLTYDRNIWTRDMDGSPSPFSMSTLLSVLFPRIFKPYDTSYTASLTPQDDKLAPSRPVCCDRNSCNCPAKPPTLEPMAEDRIPSISTSTVPGASSNAHPQGFARKKASVSSTHSLIQVPDAAQKRMSYPVTLTMWRE